MALIYREIINLEFIETLAKLEPTRRVVYGVNTCWWKDGDPVYRTPENGKLPPLPCDPRGGMLFECNDLKGFLENAKKNESHYGKHGMKAFMAAYHGNVTTMDGKPTCFQRWEEYNDIIDETLITKNKN